MHDETMRKGKNVPGRRIPRTGTGPAYGKSANRASGLTDPKPCRNQNLDETGTLWLSQKQNETKNKPYKPF